MNIKKISKLSIILIIISLLSLILLLPFIQNIIIKILEIIKGNDLENYNKYYSLMSKVSLLAFIFFLVLGFLSIIFKFPKCSKDAVPLLSINFKNIIDNKKFFFISIIISFFICLFVRIYFINQKQSMHVDEVLSVAICNRNDYGYWGGNFFPDDKVYSSSEINEITLFDDNSIKDLIKDIIYLHIDVKDSPHTNFYYTCLRLWFFNIKTSDFNFINQYGCYLNLIFFTISFILLLFILLSFADKFNIQIPFILLIGFLNPWTISTTLFLRPYETQQCSILLLALLFIKYIKRIENKENILSVKNFIVTSLILSFSLITEYFNIFLVAILGLYLIIYLLKRKEFDILKFLIYSFVFSIIICKMLYFYWGNGFFEDRGTEALSKLSFTGICSNVLLFISQIIPVLSKNSIFLIIIIILYLIYFIYSLITKNYKLQNIIISFSLIWIFIVFFFAPFKTQRYIVPIIPLLSLIFYNKKYNFYHFCIMIVLFNVSAIFESRLVPSKEIVEHLDDGKIADIEVINNSDISTIIIVYKSKWKLDTILPYLNINKKCIFYKNISDINYSIDECFLLIEDSEFDVEEINQKKFVKDMYYFNLYK